MALFNTPRHNTLAGILLLLSLGPMLPARLALAHRQHPAPTAILMLGGGEDREFFTAEFAQQHPTLPIWVSSGSTRKRDIFQAQGIAAHRLVFDDRASDTVTNFTTLVDTFDRQGIHHVYVVTSDYHMLRAIAIATVVLGSQGIAFTPVSIPSQPPAEAPWRVVRDVGRSLLWLLTGFTGARLNPNLAAFSSEPLPPAAEPVLEEP